MTADTRTQAQKALAKITAFTGWTTGFRYGEDRVVLFIDSEDAERLAVMIGNHWSDYEKTTT